MQKRLAIRGAYCGKIVLFIFSWVTSTLRLVCKNFAVCTALEKDLWVHRQKQIDVQRKRHMRLCAPTVCVEVSLLAFLGVVRWTVWRKRGRRWYRKKRKEGGRAQYGAGTFERNSFILASPPAKGRAVWMCQNDYLSGASSAHKYLFCVSC